MRMAWHACTHRLGGLGVAASEASLKACGALHQAGQSVGC